MASCEFWCQKYMAILASNFIYKKPRLQRALMFKKLLAKTYFIQKQICLWCFGCEFLRQEARQQTGLIKILSIYNVKAFSTGEWLQVQHSVLAWEIRFWTQILYIYSCQSSTSHELDIWRLTVPYYYAWEKQKLHNQYLRKNRKK